MHSKGPLTVDRQRRSEFGIHISIDDSTGRTVAYGVADEYADLFAAAPLMLEALKAVLEVHDEPCRLDHHGLCQTHHLRSNDAGEPECEVELVRAAIAAASGAAKEEGTQ